MIYTCTITPSLDYTTYLPDFTAGKLNRTGEVYYYPGGKGINVSRVLKRLGAENVALGFTGGFTGHYIEEFLKNEGVATDFIETDEITRINVKIKSAQETELNGPGPELDSLQLNQLAEKAGKMQAGDWLVLAGSLPLSIPDAYFIGLAETCRKLGVKFVLDTSGPAFPKLIQRGPFLIKPNQEELGELFGCHITGMAEAAFYAKKLVEAGVQHVVVSMGGEGALLATSDLLLQAKAPKGKVVNTVGAGDSLVSGFIASYVQHGDAEKAFRYGVASGSATAFSRDLCTKDRVEALLEFVEVHPITEEGVEK
ncbi:MAG TPA: 1-phosphofructokinase [Planococcus sp. (in: firmicutes)]|nr:1-phosphofructokinase [Planococcus sp. (in: firmicutes)]